MDGRGTFTNPVQISKPPQQKYFKEIDSYPRSVSSGTTKEKKKVLTLLRQFAKFVSTIAKLPSQKGSHPHLLDDPRLQSPSPKIYRPYPDYESPEWKKNHRGTFKPCIGPRGKLLTQSLDDQVSAYAGIPKGMSSHALEQIRTKSGYEAAPPSQVDQH